MTLIDSLDSILMLYSYTNFPDRSLSLFERKIGSPSLSEDRLTTQADSLQPNATSAKQPFAVTSDQGEAQIPAGVQASGPTSSNEPLESDMARKKTNVMSGLSIILTMMSILVAFWYVV
jgi:high-affinity nickel-transport protein